MNMLNLSMISNHKYLIFVFNLRFTQDNNLHLLHNIYLDNKVLCSIMFINYNIEFIIHT